MPDHRNLVSRIKSGLSANWRAFLVRYHLANNATRRALGFLLGALVIVYFVFGVAFLALRYLVLPNIDLYKGNVETMASQSLNRPVSIATIHASWRGLMPQLILNNVVIQNNAGAAALSLPQVAATVSWWSVPAMSLRLHSLEINRPDLEIERDVSGKLFVGGIFIDPDKKDDGKGLDWVMSQREIVVRNGWVRWNDALRKAPKLVLNDVDVVLHNKWRTHRFALRATPPAHLAAPVDIRAEFNHTPFSQKISDYKQWKGRLYAEWRDTDLAAWKPYFDYPFEVERGRGAIQSWIAFDHARIAEVTADLKLSGVATRLRSDLAWLNLTQVSGRLLASQELRQSVAGLWSFGANGHSVGLQNFSWTTADGTGLRPTTISQTYVAGAKGKPDLTELNATTVDLKALANFAGHLPLPDAPRKMLADFAPTGQLQDFSARWQGSYPDISAYSIKGKFAGLGMSAQSPRAAVAKTVSAPALAAVPGIPGFNQLTGHIEANEKGGRLSLASRTALIRLPGYFEQPDMRFDRLDMETSWTVTTASKLNVAVQRMQFALDGISGSLSGNHSLSLDGTQGPGTADFSAKIVALDLGQIERYLPSAAPEKLREWLAGAIEAGRARDVALRLKGDLAQFPFRADRTGSKPTGIFTVSGKIDQGRLNYAPGQLTQDGKKPLWPLLDQIKGTLKIDRTRLQINADSARTSGVALSSVVATVPDLLASDATLELTGKAAGPLQEFVNFANDSPVGGWIARFTADTKASGKAELALSLQLPFRRMTDAAVDGSLTFLGNNVTLLEMLPPMSATRGTLKFNQKGFELGGVKAQFLGGPIGISGGTQRDGTTSVRASGTMTGAGLRAAYPQAATAGLLQRLSGSSAYTAQIAIKKGRPEISVESSLQGIELDFPAPLKKAARESLPLKFRLAGLPSLNSATVRDEIRMSLGSAIAAHYVRQKPVGDAGAWQVLHGGIGVNVPAPEPDSGLIANVSMATLDLDAWRRSVSSIVGAAQPGSAAKSSGGLDIAQYIQPDVLAARATTLFVMGKKLDKVVVGASHQKDVWQANIDSEQASGHVTWNESVAGSGLGLVTARLASLTIPRSEATEVSELLEGSDATTEIPGLNIIAEDFQLFGKKMGKLELVANNAAATGGREWRISKLAISNANANFKAAGKWAVRKGESVTSLTYALDILDAGKLLDRFGFVQVLKGGKGKLDGDLRWTGLPFSLDIPSLSGQIFLDMAAGQFLKVDPGAAKLLGVLSLQSLPRRLALDFRDVFSEGFAFDGVVGTGQIKQGVITTDNFKMRSVNAAVLMDGTIDIAKESQDLHVVVIPEINVGTASVVYGLVVNPVIGLGSFLAQLFFRDPLMRAFTMEYQITGPWQDPAVKKLERKTGDQSVAPEAKLGEYAHG